MFQARVVIAFVLLFLPGNTPAREERTPPTYWLRDRRCLFVILRSMLKRGPQMPDPPDTLHYATLADTSPEEINLPPFASDSDAQDHFKKGTIQRQFDQTLGRTFMSPLSRVYTKEAWGYDTDKTIDHFDGQTPMDPSMKNHVVLTRVFFEYEHELRSPEGDLLKAWGRLYARTESRDFAGKMVYQGIYLWDETNPVRPLIEQASERYHQAIAESRTKDIPPEKLEEIKKIDQSLPLALTEYYIVHTDGQPKGLLRLYNTRGVSSLPHELTPGVSPHPILDPHIDEKTPATRRVAVGNAWADLDDSRRRYASYWEFAWACAINRMHPTTQRPVELEAEARGAAVRLFTGSYRLPNVAPQPSGDSTLSIPAYQFLNQNEQRIRDALERLEPASPATAFYPHWMN